MANLIAMCVFQAMSSHEPVNGPLENRRSYLRRPKSCGRAIQLECLSKRSIFLPPEAGALEHSYQLMPCHQAHRHNKAEGYRSQVCAIDRMR